MRILTIAAGILAFCATVCSGFGQALVEGAMVHANLAATTAKVGSVLGDALNKTMSGNAHKINSSIAGNIEHVPHARSKTVQAGATESSGPLVITSIRGGHKRCAVSQAPLEPKSSESQTPTPQAQESPSQDCGNPLATQSKSVINLSFPK
ncbi:MAG: hypothetical protein ACM3WP_04190 [Acidobacteriota bacterium]